MDFQILQKNIKGCVIFYPVGQVIPSFGTTDRYLFQAFHELVETIHENFLVPKNL